MIGWLLRRTERNERVFTVHEPPGPTGARLGRAEDLVFLRDGFSFGAALAPPIWFLAKGEWLWLLGYIAVAALAPMVMVQLGVPPLWVLGLVLAFNVFIGFEASSLQRYSLAWRGWHEIGTVSGLTIAECERRFFADWLAGGTSQPTSRSQGA